MSRLKPAGSPASKQVQVWLIRVDAWLQQVANRLSIWVNALPAVRRKQLFVTLAALAWGYASYLVIQVFFH
jgi:hypothetical protein